MFDRSQIYLMDHKRKVSGPHNRVEPGCCGRALATNWDLTVSWGMGVWVLGLPLRSGRVHGVVITWGQKQKLPFEFERKII